MNKFNWGAAALAVVLAGAAFVIAADDAKPEAAPQADAVTAADEASERPDKRADKKAKPVRLTKPWKMLTSLSEEQRTQIAQIHRKAIDEIKVIEAREREEIMAVLSDEQKSELTALMEQEAAARKAKRPSSRKRGAEGGGKPAPDTETAPDTGADSAQ